MAGNDREQKDNRACQNECSDESEDLFIRFSQRNDVADSTDRGAGLVADESGHGHNAFAGLQPTRPCTVVVRAGKGIFIIRDCLGLVRRKADGSGDDLPGLVDDHQLHALLIREIFHIAARLGKKIGGGFSSVA